MFANVKSSSVTTNVVVSIKDGMRTTDEIKKINRGNKEFATILELPNDKP